MNALFGISMDTIMQVTLALFVAITAMIAGLAVRNRLMFKLGLRNIPRRRAQTMLIVVGLMLSTVIITSAFGTGDTLSYSIRASALTHLGAIDEMVFGKATFERGLPGYFPASLAGTVRGALAGGRLADGVTGAIVEQVALQDMTSRQTKASVELLGLSPDAPTAFGALTTASGAIVTTGELRSNEIDLNQAAAQALDAHSGDRIQLYVAGQPLGFTVREILRDQSLAAGGLLGGGSNADSAVLLPLDRAQRIVGRAGMLSVILVSNQGDAIAGATLSDKVVAALQAPLADPAQVAAVKALLSAPAGRTALQGLLKDHSLPVATRNKLRRVQGQLGAAGASTALKSLLNDSAVSDALKGIKAPAIAAPLNTALAAISDYNVRAVKQRALAAADLAGSVISSIFLVFGLFSITAGIMLIFLIFVMLAAERRAEMGMARAVGTKRRHLIEQFLFEGYAYDLGAALVGVGLGIGVGLGMTSIIASLVGTFGFTLQPRIAPRSIVVSFCLGALVTFLTVAFSSWRVSRLNIVAAIRDLPEDLHVDGSIGGAFRRPLLDLRTAGRRLRRGRILTGLKALLAAPWHFVSAFRVFISRGPLLLIAGYLLMGVGIRGKQAFPFDLGISLLLIGAAMVLRWALGGLRVPDRVRNRIGFSLAGIALVVFWLLPFDAIRSDLHSDVEMFFLSGIMLVLGGVWTLMYNSDLLLGGLLLAFGRVGALAVVLRTAVTYALQNRFRTGLTLSMFSLVIFTLMVMSVLTDSFSGQGYNSNRDIGGYDVYGFANPLNPIQNAGARIAANPALRGRITASGGSGVIDAGLRQPGQKDQTWQPFGVDVADDAYLSSTRYTLHGRARGYATDAQVWQAVRTHPGYAVVMSYLAGTRNAHNNNGGGFVHGLYYEDTSFKPVMIQMRDARTGAIIPLTIIGVLDQSSAFADNVYIGASTLAAAHDIPATPTQYFFRVAPGRNVHETALALGSAFLANGLDVREALVEYDKGRALNIGLNNLLEGFMALGLVVGIAALGVVATRSVVERRQQIGMMRAIGFRRGMVQASFLLESSFISIAGTALGSVLGLLLARQLVTFFGKSNPSLHVIIPWAQVGLIVALAYVASLLTTYLPAWQASRIYPAEALRYE